MNPRSPYPQPLPPAPTPSPCPQPLPPAPTPSPHPTRYPTRSPTRPPPPTRPPTTRLCAKYAFDLVLIDGNEYTGWGEFVHVRDECRPTWIALHDTGTLKTRKIEAFMQTAENTDYELHLRCDPDQTS